VSGIRAVARVLCLSALLAGCAGGRGGPGETLRPGGAPTLIDSVVQSGLSVPWDLAFAPDGRLFVTERMGTILMFENGSANARRLGSTRGFVYVCASRREAGEWRNQILRFKASADTLDLDGYVIRTGMLAASIHDGCRLAFGADGKLWATMGDTGNGKLAQDPNGLNGKVLRMNPDGSVPDDNPILPGAAKRTVAYSMGHRNPQGLAVQPGSKLVFEVEHGNTTNDEINVLLPGKNYGWPEQEGPGGVTRGFIDPIWTSGTVTYATSGAAFVTGDRWGSWSGSLFIATLKEQDLRRFEVTGTTVVPKEVLYDQKYGRLRSVVVGPDGALYVTTSNGSGDRIVRVAAQ